MGLSTLPPLNNFSFISNNILGSISFVGESPVPPPPLIGANIFNLGLGASSANLPLTYELRNMGIPVVNFTPSRGNDKHTRVNSVAPLFESGMIWAPDQKFAQEVIEECAAFPYGDHDDLVDSMTQAVMRFRQGGLIPHPEDYKDEKIIKTKHVYY